MSEQEIIVFKRSLEFTLFREIINVHTYKPREKYQKPVRLSIFA
jgi:hypothetical protein